MKEVKKIILAEKKYMSQIFNAYGEAVPVTVLKAGPVTVTQKKTEEKDSYDAVQVGFRERRKVKKPIKGIIKGTILESTGVRWLKEFRGVFEKNKGDIIDVSIFEEGDKVKATGISKGKGFQGGVKRHGFHGAPKTHGTKHAHRQPGSIGSTGPQRVFKGKKMAGHMGAERVTVKNLRVVKVDVKNNLLYIKGAIPGHKGSLIEISG